MLSIACSLIISCSSFIPEDDVEKLKFYESDQNVYHDYIMLKDVKINEFTLEKGTRVRIVISAGDEWVKVYAYKADEDVLKSNRILILHLFDTDFPENKFSREFFDKELALVIQKAGAGSNTERKEKKPVKKKGKQK